MNNSGANFKLINWVKIKSIRCVLLFFVIIYILINLLFGFIYYWLDQNNNFIETAPITDKYEEEYSSEIKSHAQVTDYIYFSFITASTIGYGDYYPTATLGKILVTIQSVFYSVYVPVMMSIITSKLLWPSTNTIIFSKKILYNMKLNNFQVRVINTNSMPIINPEIRITLTQHGIGDIIAGVIELDNSTAKPIYLGRHDFILQFGQSILKTDMSPKYTETDIIRCELDKAHNYQKNENKKDSRFRITITISGSNGVQNIAQIKKYYVSDFVMGTGFSSIKYGENDTDKLGMKYNRISDFWCQFDKIENEEEIVHKTL